MALYGIYGSHTVDACPVNNLEVAKAFVAFAESDPTPLRRKHGIHDVLGQYHSAFEHTRLKSSPSRLDSPRLTLSRSCR